MSKENTNVQAPKSGKEEIANTVAALRDTFPAKGRIGVRQDGQPQAAFNLLIQDESAIMEIERLAEAKGFSPYSPSGDVYVEITLDQNSRAAVKRGAPGAAKVTVEGTLSIVDVVIGNSVRIKGSMKVTKASPVSLLNGGRIVTPTARA